MRTEEQQRERAHWITELAAAGPKSASSGQREAFASAVISRLGTAYAQGQRSEHAYEIENRFRDAVWKVRMAIHRLDDAISSDQVSARRNGLTAADLETFTGPLELYLSRADEIVADDDALWHDRAFSKPRRGRKNRAAIEVAEMIAWEYDKHFGKPAGRSKQADKNNPFFRVCKVVERILAAAGYKNVSLGDKARSEGIDRACVAAIKEMLGMGPTDKYVIGDPRTMLLLKRKNGQ